MTSSAKPFDLVVVGEINPDLILSGDVVPEFGQVEKIVDDATLTLGSSSVIFACGMARLGLRVAFLGKIGRDEFGDFMRSQMTVRGIDATHLVVDPNLKTGVSVILSRGADRSILTYSGSIGALRPEELDLDLLVQARHLHIGSYYLLDALRPSIPSIFRQAREMGMTTSLDTNYDPTEQWEGGIQETLKHTDIFLPNETELLSITRVPRISKALEVLCKTVAVVCVKLGARGAVARHGTNVTRSSALKVKIVDTIGAGDSFDAGFIYGRLNDWDLERTIRLACICGSLSTLTAGGCGGQPTLDEALPYMN